MMPFWKKKIPIKEGVDFCFINFKDTDLTGIELLIPEYSGVVYHYGRVKMVEEGLGSVLKFGYTLVHSGKHDMDALIEDQNFHTIMGDILTEILSGDKKL
jgi:hypothetical protein